MKRAQGRTSAEWSRLVSEQSSSGEARKAWCDARGINVRTFREWACKLKRGEAGTAMDWIEMEAQAAPPCEDPSAPGLIEVFIGPYSVRVKPGFDSALFADVCKSLSGLC